MADRPPAEVEVDAALVRRLLEEQHPDLAHLPLALVAEGWDNVVLRLGDALAVRVPRREAGARLVAKEQRWLPELAPRLPLAVPSPLRVGRPSPSFPWAWSVVPWFPGRDALGHPRPSDLVVPLAAFLAALHAPAPPDAPRNPVRGVPLVERDEAVRARLERLRAAPQVHTIWQDALSAGTWAGPPTWFHGDLHPGNLVLDERGRLRAVVDFGDLGAGDPAVDLAVAWLLGDPEVPLLLREALAGVHPEPEATWRRARGWALVVASALLCFSDDAYRSLGEGALRALVTESQESLRS